MCNVRPIERAVFLLEEVVDSERVRHFVEMLSTFFTRKLLSKNVDDFRICVSKCLVGVRVKPDDVQHKPDTWTDEISILQVVQNSVV